MPHVLSHFWRLFWGSDFRVRPMGEVVLVGVGVGGCWCACHMCHGDCGGGGGGGDDKLRTSLKSRGFLKG